MNQESKKFIKTLQIISGINAKEVTINTIIKTAWKYSFPESPYEPEVTGILVHPMDSDICVLGYFDLRIKGEFRLDKKQKEDKP